MDFLTQYREKLTAPHFRDDLLKSAKEMGLVD